MLFRRPLTAPSGLRRLPPLAALAAVLLWAGCGGQEPPREPGNIVVVTIDTLRADHLSCYGYFRPTSPNIDRLAEEGVLFENAVTTMATTLPAHVSLWTSRYPVQTGVTTNGKKILIQAEKGNRVRFFAQMLQEIGYRTAAFVSATPVKAYTGIDAGFDLFDEPPVGGRKANATTERVLAWLDEGPPEPFFLWIHYFDPHKKYDPPEPYRSRFSTDERLLQELNRRGVTSLWRPEIPQFNNLYDGEILFVDDQLGRLFDRLRETGRYDQTTLVVTSDHGEALGEHRRIGHGEIYNEQLFVPLVIKFPGGSRLNGTRQPHLISLVDLIPTLTATLGLPIPEADRAQFSGVDVLGGERRTFAIAQRTFGPPRKWGPGEKFSLVSLRWKYAYLTDGPDQLFDMRTDRAEITNLVQVEPEVAEEMKNRLLLDLAEQSERKGGLSVVQETSPQVLKELRALGYVQ